MYILVCYDVNTETDAGKTRLRKIARACENHGQRVQNSVFECSLEPARYVTFKQELRQIMDEDVDSLRFYHLGKEDRARIESFGNQKGYYRVDDALII